MFSLRAVGDEKMEITNDLLVEVVVPNRWTSLGLVSLSKEVL